MKIITLHFKNVNSLAGEWTLRFDDPAFLRNHLFAIAGPTGSGKLQFWMRFLLRFMERHRAKTALRTRRSWIMDPNS